MSFNYIHDKDLKPLFMVPSKWNVCAGWSHDGPSVFRFCPDQAMRLADYRFRDTAPSIDAKRTIAAVDLRNLNGTIYAILLEGFDALIDHPEVAAFPLAHQRRTKA